MTELKTLKDFFIEENHYDFDEIDLHCYLLNPIQLKQEAIKWIKEFQTKLSRFPKDENGFISTYDEGDWCEISGKIYWIKHFFNITEEELK